MAGTVGHKNSQVTVARLPERKQSRVGRGGAGVLEFGTEKIDNLEIIQQLDPDARLTCTVNGQIRQDTPLSAMIWDVAGLVAHLSRLVRLAPGDLIYTGTPAGVGPLVPGDTCTVTITGLPEATVTLG